MTTTLPAIAPATYRIDPDRSTVRFAIRGMFGLATVKGMFTVRDGTIVVTDQVSRSTVRATLDAASFDTANRRRDNDVRSKRFLDTARYPEMWFTSREVTADTVTGMLCVHGSVHRVTLALAPVDTTDGCRFTATTRIDRYAFGVTAAKGLVGRFLDVELEIVASRL